MIVFSFREENQSLTDDYERITDQHKELQKKFRLELMWEKIR